MNADATLADPVPPPTRRSRWGGWAFVVTTIALTGLVAWTVGPQTVGEKARRVFLQQLVDRYPDWRVSIGRGTFQNGVGFVFQDIELSQPMAAAGGGRQGLWIDRLVADATIDPADAAERFGQMMTRDSPPPQSPLIQTSRLSLQGVRLVTPVAAGTDRLAIASLWPPPMVGPGCPVTELSEVSISLVPTGPGAPPRRELRMTGVRVDKDLTTGVQRIGLTGWDQATGVVGVKIETRPDGGIDIDASCPSVNLNEEAARWALWVAGSTTQPPRHLRMPFAARVSARCRGGVWQIHADALPREGSIDDPRLPAALSKIAGRIVLADRTLQWNDLTVGIGHGTCRSTGLIDWQSLPPGRWPRSMGDVVVQSNVVADGLVVGPELAGRLPRDIAEGWAKTRPTGPINASVQLRYPGTPPAASQPWRLAGEGQRPPGWSIAGSLQARGVSVRVAKFPYPVDAVTGEMTLAEGRIVAKQLVGSAGGQTLRCHFDMPLPPELGGPDDPRRLVVVTTDGPLPIDDSLIGALTDPQSTDVDEKGRSPAESFIRSLRPRGSVQLAEARLSVDAAGGEHKQVDLRVVGGAMRFDAFAYPLYDVSGRVKIEDDSVRMIGFSAANAGNAHVAADGLFELRTPIAKRPLQPPGRSDEFGPPELNMTFRIADLDLDQPLRVALPPDSREIWDAISPSGVLDRLELHLHRTGTGPLEIVARGEQLGVNHSTGNHAGLSIRPTAVPYRVDVTRGSVAYRDGVVTIGDVRGRHGESRFDIDGDCRRDESGQWSMRLTHQPGSRLLIDSELIAAVPPGPASALQSLDLRGAIGVRGTTRVHFADASRFGSEPTFDWDLQLQLEGNRIGGAEGRAWDQSVHSIRGEVVVRGEHDGFQTQASGTVAIDSLHAYGYQFTALRGPFAIAGDELRLGNAAGGRKRNRSATASENLGSRAVNSPLVGRLFGGVLDVGGVMDLPSGTFDMAVSLDQAPVAEVTEQLGGVASDLTGRLHVNLQLDGQLGDTDLLRGTGSGTLSGANLYELPWAAQLLGLLSIKPAEDAAFTDGAAEFALFGWDVNFTRLQLWGDLVALDGGGTVSETGQLDLTFNTRVSPHSIVSRVISPLRDQRYTLWTIEVDGSINDPTVRRYALSGISQSIEQWFPSTVRTSGLSGP